MKVTERTREALEQRRFAERMRAIGFERVGEGGGKLWEIYRGNRIGQQITQAAIEPGGMAVWVKIELRAPDGAQVPNPGADSDQQRPTMADNDPINRLAK